MGVPQGTPASSFNLGNLLHMIVYGQHPNTGQLAQQTSFVNSLKQAFNPTTPSGAVNILSTLFGGGDSPLGEFTGPHDTALPNPGLPGRYEPYTMAKSPVRTLEGTKIRADIEGVKTGKALSRSYQIAPSHFTRDPIEHAVTNLKAIHDALFGGEVHARGPIPSKEAALAALIRAHTRR